MKKSKENRYIRADAKHQNIQTVVVSGTSKERGETTALGNSEDYKIHFIKRESPRDAKKREKKPWRAAPSNVMKCLGICLEWRREVPLPYKSPLQG